MAQNTVFYGLKYSCGFSIMLSHITVAESEQELLVLSSCKGEQLCLRVRVYVCVCVRVLYTLIEK